MVTKKTVRKETVSHRGTSGGGELHMPPFQHYDYAMDHVSALSFSTPCPGYSPQIAGPPMHPLAHPPSKKAKRNHHQSTTASSSKKSRVALQVLPTPVKAMSKAEAAAVPMQNPYSTSRGLRHFSMKVCEKVEEKGTTTYNEVADELVKELKAAEKAINAAAAARGEKIPEPKPKKINKKTGKAKKTHDDKNIRRRVYDALNVLMAMDIITKDKKEITWRGLPGNRVDQNDLGDGSGTDSATGDGSSGGVFSPNKRKADGLSRHQRLQQMQDERTKRQQEIMQKRECLQQLMTQNVCLQNLLARNHAREVQEQHRNRFIVKREGPEDNITHQDSQDSCDVKEIIGEKIPLPFLIVNTDSRAVAQCEMCPERTNVSFDFSLPFEINDDNEILKRLGMSHTSMEALQRSLPPDLHHYAWRNGLLQAIARS